jgi:hypothetical protein
MSARRGGWSLQPARHVPARGKELVWPGAVTPDSGLEGAGSGDAAWTVEYQPGATPAWAGNGGPLEKAARPDGGSGGPAGRRKPAQPGGDVPAQPGVQRPA